MVLSWALTEVVRYLFYACSLVGFTIPALLYLRYTMFYILYPTGASSEAFLIYAALPASPPYPGWQSWLHGMWKPADYVRAGLFLIWWPCNYATLTWIAVLSNQLFSGLYVMYTHMLSQRRKVFRLGNKKTQ